MPPIPTHTTNEPEDIYHARSKSGECMSSGMLKKFRDCPHRYHQLVTGQARERDSNALRFGRAVHKIVLEGIPAFNKTYAVGGPINPKTGKCFAVGTKAHDEWLAENGYSRDRVITDEEHDVLVTLANMARRHHQAATLLEFGWPELVVRETLHGVPCQIRMDWLTHDADGNFAIVDLKTTEDITWFERDAWRYGYHRQFAFYRDVFQLASGIPVQVLAIVLEKKEPFRAGVWRIPESVLDSSSVENRISLEHYLHCKKHDEWPTGYEATREFTLPAAASA